METTSLTKRKMSEVIGRDLQTRWKSLQLQKVDTLSFTPTCL